jgi:outer membrane protein assembly factor BamE (lipoprotein component of BamABCDE complex)
VSYAARIGADGKLIAIEQRLTRENFEQLKRGESRADDVRDLLGPPWRVDQYPRREREAWTYQAQGIAPQIIVTYFSRDGVLREKEMFNDPEQAAKDGPM